MEQFLMKYLVKGEDGREYGPIDKETMRKWTEAGRVLPETPVRNVLINKWNKASDLDFLLPAFAVQGVREEKEKNSFSKFSEHLDALFSGGKAKKEKLTPWETSFKNKYLHDPASLSLRFSAFAFDLIIIGGFSIFLLLHFHASFTHLEKPVQNESAISEIPSTLTGTTAGTASAESSTDAPSAPSAGSDTETKTQAAVQMPQAPASPTPESISEVNSAFNRSFYIFVTCVLLYYGLSLGIFAQTFGMWFWGIMLAKTDLEEVLFGRAYFFTVLMLLIGVLSPLVVFFNPYKRSLHEILSGTMVIRIVARPKT
jgi:hypothetical protein